MCGCGNSISEVGGPGCPGMRTVISYATGVRASMRDSFCRGEISCSSGYNTDSELSLLILTWSW